MKNITRFFVLFVLCLSALVSCSKEEQVQQGKKLQVTPDALFFTRAATSQTLELKTNASQWTATVSKNDWPKGVQIYEFSLIFLKGISHLRTFFQSFSR